MKSSLFFRISVALLLLFLTAAACAAQKGPSMAIDRINVIDAQKLVKSGDVLLVCSYDDNRCKEILLEGAIFLSGFESKLPSLPKTQPIIFYCA
jgi:hypothetical protein